MHTIFHSGDRHEESPKAVEKCEVCVRSCRVLHWEDGNPRGVCTACLPLVSPPAAKQLYRNGATRTSLATHIIGCVTWSGGAF